MMGRHESIGGVGAFHHGRMVCLEGFHDRARFQVGLPLLRIPPQL